ncbi:hypothetical protein H5410_022866 [Solanum commersonii]|uniref:Uncharacterized protein n=1 Tax=Solanum commersonii TaxID=4109 RepID=A0A9J5ZF88_SOLCO|nr:hypothetical protein H5410_022866 [Solanum commersonii]
MNHMTFKNIQFIVENHAHTWTHWMILPNYVTCCFENLKEEVKNLQSIQQDKSGVEYTYNL